MHVLVRRSELLTELLRSQPTVEAGRGVVLLRIEQRTERGLLLHASRHHQLHPLHRKIRRSRASVEPRECHRVRVPLQRYQAGIIHRLCNSRSNGSGLRFANAGNYEEKNGKKEI